MKKLIFALVIAIAIFSLASCGDSSECEHDWETVTTPPTCTKCGYDMMICKLCGKSVKTNETAPKDHTYGDDFFTDDEYHWLKCIECGTVKDKGLHTIDDDGACTLCQHVSATPGVIYDKSADGTYAEVVGYNGTATKVKIAEEYEDLPVKNIYDNAFAGDQTIKSVVIPDSVTSIGWQAFSGCNSLTSVVIPVSVTSISNSAFSACNSLTSVVIPDSVTSVGQYAFRNCDFLKFNEYGNCKYLGSESNPYFALIEVSNRNMSSYEIHKDTQIIAGGAFYECSQLVSIVIPDSVTSIGDNAFQNCERLTSVVIPDGVTSIGGGVFSGCISLTSVVIPDSVTSIGAQAFSGCTSLTSVVIGDSVTSIDCNTFNSCHSLTSVVIGNSVTSIGESAFFLCDSLTDVYYTGTEEEWVRISMDSYKSGLTNATIHYNYVLEE